MKYFLTLLVLVFLLSPNMALSEETVPVPEIPQGVLDDPSEGTLALRALAAFAVAHPELMGDQEKFWEAWNADKSIDPKIKEIVSNQRELLKKTGENLDRQIEETGRAVREAADKAVKQAQESVDKLQKQMNPMLEDLNKSIQKGDAEFQGYMNKLNRELEGYTNSLNNLADEALNAPPAKQ